MERQASLATQDYLRRINRVFDYIQANLDGDLRLETLSSVAAFSPFHFHRVFRGVTGETVAECIRRLRLQRGAHRLRYHPGIPVTDVALEVGFGSHSAFSRAFKDHFGLTPSEWASSRLDSKMDQADGKAGISAIGEAGYPPWYAEYRRMLMNPQFEDIDSQRYVYWRAVGPYGPEGEITEAWQKAYAWAGVRGLLDGDYRMFGISHDDPAVTPAEQCRYDACVAVPDGVDVSGQNEQRLVPGRYAVFSYEGDGADFSGFFTAIYAGWLPSSGFVPGDGPCFERYAPEHRMDGGGFSCDVCLPVTEGTGGQHG
jgi:AraC family transcriptional regulator